VGRFVIKGTYRANEMNWNEMN